MSSKATGLALPCAPVEATVEEPEPPFSEAGKVEAEVTELTELVACFRLLLGKGCLFLCCELAVDLELSEVELEPEEDELELLELDPDSEPLESEPDSELRGDLLEREERLLGSTRLEADTLLSLEPEEPVEALSPDRTELLACPLSLLLLVELQVDIGLALEPRSLFRYTLEDLTDEERSEARPDPPLVEAVLAPAAGDIGASFQEPPPMEELRPLP